MSEPEIRITSPQMIKTNGFDHLLKTIAKVSVTCRIISKSKITSSERTRKPMFHFICIDKSGKEMKAVVTTNVLDVYEKIKINRVYEITDMLFSAYNEDETSNSSINIIIKKTTKIEDVTGINRSSFMPIESKVVSFNEIRYTETNNKCDVRGIVHKIYAIDKWMKSLRMKIVLKDGNDDEMMVSLWNDKIMELEEGDAIYIKNVYINPTKSCNNLSVKLDSVIYVE